MRQFGVNTNNFPQLHLYKRWTAKRLIRAKSNPDKAFVLQSAAGIPLFRAAICRHGDNPDLIHRTEQDVALPVQLIFHIEHSCTHPLLQHVPQPEAVSGVDASISSPLSNTTCRIWSAVAFL